MLIGILASISALLPWLLGAALGLHAARLCASLPGFNAIAVGVGGFLGYLAAALTLWLADQVGILLLQYRFLLALGALTIFAVASFLPFARFDPLQSRLSVVSVILIGLFTFYIIYTGLMISNLPAQGWDVFDHWGKVAALFVDHSLSGQPQPFEYDHYHPKTLSLVLAWSSWCGTLYGNTGTLVWSMPWLGFSISGVLIAAGWTYNQTLSLNLALALSLVAISIPLSENHILIAGYSEFPVGLAVMAGTVLGALSLQRESATIFVAAALVTLTPILLKNIGIAYALAPVAASVLLWVLSLRPKTPWIMALSAAIALITIIAAIYIAYHGLVFDLGGNSLGYDAHTQTIQIGGRSLELAIPAAADLFENELQSRLLNSSFSICLIAIALAISTSLAHSCKVTRESIPLYFIALTFAFLLLEQFFSQFTSYGFKFAVPTKDTGLSRFSLPAFMLTPILIATTLKRKVWL